MKGRMNPVSLFSLNEHLETVEDDMVEKLGEIVNFEIFRGRIEGSLGYGYKPQGGRPPFDGVLMFKVLILQSMHNFSDKKTERMVRGYLPWMAFLGLSPGDSMPDENTIRHFRDRLTETGALPVLLQAFDDEVRAHGYDAMAGHTVDASLVPSPRQRFIKEEQDLVKEGKSAQEIWADEPNKAAQKDVNARWVSRVKFYRGSDGKPEQKVVKSEYGWNFHVNADNKWKIIRRSAVTPANVHDSRCFKELLDCENTAKVVYADSAYSSEEIKEFLKEKGIRRKIIDKKPRGKAMPAARARANTKISRKRSRVEHVFGHMKNRFGLYIRTIGLKRAETKLSLAVLAYNMDRLIFLEGRRCSVG